MNFIMVTDATRNKAAEAMAYADANRINMHHLMSIMGKRAPSPGDDPKRVIFLPPHFYFVYTIEQQPMGWCRHITLAPIKMDSGIPVPPPEVCEALIDQVFGLKLKIDDAVSVWTDNGDHDNPNTINVVWKLNNETTTTNETE